MIAPDHAAAEFTLPTLELRSLARRAIVPVLIGAVVAAFVVIGGHRIGAISSVLHQALGVNAVWTAAGIAFECISVAGYVAVLALVAGRGDVSHRDAGERRDRARRDGRDPPAPDRRSRRRSAGRLVAAAIRPERGARDSDAARIPRRPVFGVPARDRARWRGVGDWARAQRRPCRAERAPGGGCSDRDRDRDRPRASRPLREGGSDRRRRARRGRARPVP